MSRFIFNDRKSITSISFDLQSKIRVAQCYSRILNTWNREVFEAVAEIYCHRAFRRLSLRHDPEMLSEVFFKLFLKQTASPKLDGSIMAYLRRIMALVSGPLFFARAAFPLLSTSLPLLFAAPVARVRPRGRRIHGILHSRRSLFTS